MKAHSKVSLFALAVLVMGTACDAPPPDASPAMFRGDEAHSGVYDTRGVERLGGVLWSVQTDGPVRSTPTVSGGIVYVGSSDGYLYALDRVSGSRLWRTPLGSSVSATPAVASGLVIVGSRNGTFHALNARSGAERWRFETGELLPWEWGFEGWDVYTSSPVVAGSSVLFGAGDGYLYAVEVETGSEQWRFETGGRIRSSPAVSDGVAFVGSIDGVVYAVDVEDGSLRWTHEPEGVSLSSAGFGFDRKSIVSSPSVVDGSVYVGSRDGFMYALDETTGTRRWRADHQVSWAMSSPAVSNDIVYSGTSDGQFIHALGAESGEEIWRFVGDGYSWSSPSVVGNTVHIGFGDGHVRAFDRVSGEVRWSFRSGGAVYSSPVVADGVLFFGSDDGKVYALSGGTDRMSARAVFWDEELSDASYYPMHEVVRDYLNRHGYEILDSRGLQSFLENRISDGLQSVVVFALDQLPATVASEPSDTVLFRRYLDSGGKTVWLGLPPMLVGRDPETGSGVVDRGRPSALLGVDFSSLNYDFYGASATEEGLRWGLGNWWVGTLAIDTSGIDVALGLDENGRTTAWTKTYGGSPGGGFVCWTINTPSVDDLSKILALAEYGLSGR